MYLERINTINKNNKLGQKSSSAQKEIWLVDAVIIIININIITPGFLQMLQVIRCECKAGQRTEDRGHVLTGVHPACKALENVNV